MKDDSFNTPMIVIDSKNSRIRIHRNTLHLLGDPKYIQLLVNPQQLTLAILPSQELKTANAVRWDRIAERKSCELYSKVKVSRRQGVNYVFNGQHTIEIVALVSGSRDTPVWCMIYDDLEYEQEADIFANQQRFVKKLLPYEIFVANIEAGNDEQLIIKALVESFDLRICGNSRPGCICCVATLEDLYRKYGYEILQRSLRLCIATWEGDTDSLTSNILRGITHLLVAYKDSLKDDMFVEKVGRFSPREIGRIAKERKAGSIGYAEAMLTLYNKKSSSSATLKWAKLYENKQGM